MPTEDFFTLDKIKELYSTAGQYDSDTIDHSK